MQEDKYTIHYEFGPCTQEELTRLIQEVKEIAGIQPLSVTDSSKNKVLLQLY